MNIPQDLLRQAVKLSGATTQTMAVIMGLEELIRRKRLEALTKFRGLGAVRFSPKALRSMRAR